MFVIFISSTLKKHHRNTTEILEKILLGSR
nr:MAG TPA: hypothetical protein [Caudoviricetes sp.]